MAHQDSFQTIRSLIEDVFKLAKCVLFKEIPQVYYPLCEKNGLSECTFSRARYFFGISLKEATTAAR
jgi:hypothetical protein